MTDLWRPGDPLLNRAKRRAQAAPPDSLAFRLSWLLTKYKITPTEIERRGGPTRSFLSHVFNGERNPSYDQLVKIARAIPELTIAEMQWLFICRHFIAPAWEGIIDVHITEGMPDRPDAPSP